jgi:flagellar basal body-associated protein FliL
LGKFKYDDEKKTKEGGKEMKILLGGIVALIIGVVGLIGWWADFVEVLKGIIPIILILGGALATYLGIEEVKTTSSAKKEESTKEETEKKS